MSHRCVMSHNWTNHVAIIHAPGKVSCLQVAPIAHEDLESWPIVRPPVSGFQEVVEDGAEVGVTGD